MIAWFDHPRRHPPLTWAELRRQRNEDMGHEGFIETASII
jgi:hypothetical protein